MRKHGWLRIIPLAVLIIMGLGGRAQAAVSAPISYRLPYEEGVQKTYLVTLVISLKEEPDWIVSHVISGAPRTVNDSNKGEFTENWDLTDDNFAPLPRTAKYYARGIYAPAEKWKMDGQWHSLIPKFVASPGDSWAPEPARDNMIPPVYGHLMEPFYRISVAENGLAAFWAGYIENWQNPFLVDLKKPVGIDQVLRRYPSGGFAGGHAVAFDGRDIWYSRFRTIKSTRGGFGVKRDKYGNMITVLGEGHKGIIRDLNVLTDGGAKYLYSADATLKKVFVVNAHNGLVEGEIPIDAAATQPDRVNAGKRIYILHKAKDPEQWEVIGVPLEDGMPAGKAETQFVWRDSLGRPGDLTMDYDGNFYVLAGGHAYKVSPSGEVLLRFGKDASWVGKYDPLVLASPTSIEAWKDPDGKNRLLINEGVNMSRISEWSCDDGSLIRDWFLCQNAYSGFAIDDARPEHVYSTVLVGNVLFRWLVDYETGKWKLDARWPLKIGKGLFPYVVNHSNGKYVGMMSGGYRVWGSYRIYKVDGYDLKPSSGNLAKLQYEHMPADGWWHDANGNGVAEADEYDGPNRGPGGRYWGDMLLDDLSIMHIPKRGYITQRLAPAGFDEHGNPYYDGTKWTVPFVDTIVKANREGPAPDALHGGNEVGREFWDWSKLVGSMRDGFYVAGVYWPDKPAGGVDTAGRVGRMWKLTRYVPNGSGGFKMKWRVGRDAPGVAKPGEVYGSQHISKPAYGMIGVHDANGLFHVFTDKGMYVDTMMYHNFKYGNQPRGGTYVHSGESWFGKSYINHDNGNVYVCQGRASLNIYEVPNWKPGFLKPLQIKTPDGTYEARE